MSTKGKPPTPISRPTSARKDVPGAPRVTQPATRGIKVRATRTGYYDEKRRREGDVFLIREEAAFAKSWMERVDPTTPEHTTSAPEALARQLASQRGEAQSVDTPTDDTDRALTDEDVL